MAAALGLPEGRAVHRLLRRGLADGAPIFLGPLLVLTVLHMTGATQSVPPTVLVTTAQLIWAPFLVADFLGSAQAPWFGSLP
ncbi:hypothetical protein [Cypionkella sp.]|uniref:hypothetical protein n=1 Tax=Cypionkella sp. TaxID=2811411 RepID=UPI00351DDFCE